MYHILLYDFKTFLVQQNIPLPIQKIPVHDPTLNISPQEGEGNPSDKKEKRHRRSKNDPVGRKYVCDICSKSYLSAPALSSHRKTKHFQNEEKKGRGRPRKYVRFCIIITSFNSLSLQYKMKKKKIFIKISLKKKKEQKKGKIISL